MWHTNKRSISYCILLGIQYILTGVLTAHILYSHVIDNGLTSVRNFFSRFRYCLGSTCPLKYESSKGRKDPERIINVEKSKTQDLESALDHQNDPHQCSSVNTPVASTGGALSRVSLPRSICSVGQARLLRPQTTRALSLSDRLCRSPTHQVHLPVYVHTFARPRRDTRS